MNALLVLALSGAFAAPPEGGEAFYAGVWSDLASNALIGHGNVAAFDWYWVAEHDQRQMHIGDFVCRKAGREHRQCRFTLLRDGGPAALRDRMVSDRLTCSARFQRGVDGAWYVVRKPPRGGGHTITTMRCKAA